MNKIITLTNFRLTEKTEKEFYKLLNYIGRLEGGVEIHFGKIILANTIENPRKVKTVSDQFKALVPHAMLSKVGKVKGWNIRTRKVIYE